MNDQTYSVVGLDGREYKDVEYALIREWYAARRLNRDSLIFSAETGEWKKLMNVFDIAEFDRARSLLARQKFAAQQSDTAPPAFDQRQTASPNAAFNQPFQPSRGYAAQPRSSSGWKIAIGIVGVVLLMFFGLVGAGAYLVSKINFGQSAAQRDKVLTELKKYEIPGTEFVDQTSGAKVTLPKDWRMLKPDNPLVPIYNQAENGQELKRLNLSENMMLATDKLGNRVLLLEIVNFPNGIDQVAFFNKSVELMESEILSDSEPGTYKRLTELTIPLADGMAKKFVFERVSKFKNPRAAEFGLDGENNLLKGQMVLMANSNNAFVLQMWSQKDEFDDAVTDFNFIEKNFSMPRQTVR